MEIEEKIGSDANQVTAPVTNPDTVAPVVEPSTTEVTEAPIDYQALYEKEKEKLAKAEFTLYKKNKAERVKHEDDSSTGYVDQDEIKRLVQEEAMTLLQTQRQKDAEDIIEEEMMNLSSNEDERRLIRFKYDNSLVKTGYSRIAIRQDLEEAKFLANRLKYQKEQKELAQTAVSKQTMGNSGVGANLEKASVPDDLSKKFSATDWAWMEKRGWTDAQKREALNKSI